MESCDASRSSLFNGPKTLLHNNQVRRVRDVYTAPPTELLVSDSVFTVLSNPDGSFTIPASWVEVTEGWLRKDGAHQLSICFMHSFGKCSGRCNNDPSTCHQIHLPTAQLQQLRQLYTHPLRNFFSRTVKAKLPAAIRHLLVTHLRRSTVSLAYLEYYAHDVQPTTGYHAYEEEYGRWLRSSGVTSFESTTTEQCVEFALTSHCRVGLGCRFVHAPLTKALTRDKGVMAALQSIELQLSQPPTAATADIIPPPPPPQSNTMRPPIQGGGPLPPQQFIGHTPLAAAPPTSQTVMWSPVVFPTPHHDQSHAFNNYPPVQQPLMIQHPTGMIQSQPQTTSTSWGTPYSFRPVHSAPGSHISVPTQGEAVPQQPVQLMLVQSVPQGSWQI